MSFLTFLAFVRVFMFFLAGTTAGFHFASSNPDLCAASRHTYFGLNLFWYVGLPALIVGLWMSQPKGGTAKDKTIGVLSMILSPVAFIWGCLKLAWAKVSA